MKHRLIPRWARKSFRFIRPRSRGFRVSRSVLRFIDAGNAARQIPDWFAAAEAYRKALSEAPDLPHVWMQYGHMLRESGRRKEASDAYRHVIALDPTEREAHFLLFEIARASGDRVLARTHAQAMYNINPDDRRSQALLLQSISAGNSEDDLILAKLAVASNLQTNNDVTLSRPSVIHLDVSDLLNHFVNSRYPSGLQRVEIEVARALCALERHSVTFCSWSFAAQEWKPLSGSAFISLMDALSDEEDDSRWTETRNSVLFQVAAAPPITFPPKSTLFNLGMAWGDPLYHPAVTRIKERDGIRFAAIACDVIPLVRPLEVPHDIVAACGNWLDELARTADSIVAISHATRDEIVKVSSERECRIDPKRIGVVSLDATFRVELAESSEILVNRGLVKGKFALYVSTIEPRKNHHAALAAWHRLMTDPAASTFHLVCVGRMGWRSEEVVDLLATDPWLRRHVHFLDRVSDADLDALYEACAFTFYPSLQEGWGLPITESLARGKVPVTGRNSSLPEAGKSFAVYTDVTSPADMAAVIGRLVRDPSELAHREQAIRDGFRPRSWDEVARDMMAVALGAHD